MHEEEEQITSNIEEYAPNFERMLLPFCVVAACCFIPFCFYDFIRGNYLVSGLLVIISIVFGLNGYKLYRHQKTLIPFEILLIPAIVAIVFSIINDGIFGTYWCFPALLFFYFVLSRRTANIWAFSLLTIVSVLLTQQVPVQFIVRFSISLSLLILMANIIINASIELNQKLLEQTIIDPLTSAYNRRHMRSFLSEAVSRRQRNSTPASILIIDLDRFKRINDDLGHGVGDKVLVDIVRLVQNRIRQTDKLFRMGGEEFLVFLPETSELEAAVVAGQICRMICGAKLLEDRKVTASIGVSEISQGESVDDWIRNADKVLYQAKEAGRNRFVCRNADQIILAANIFESRAVI